MAGQGCGHRHGLGHRRQHHHANAAERESSRTNQVGVLNQVPEIAAVDPPALDAAAVQIRFINGLEVAVLVAVDAAERDDTNLRGKQQI